MVCGVAVLKMINEVLVKMTIASNTQGKYVEIGDVVSGLQSDCFCISCQRQLVAKKGQFKLNKWLKLMPWLQSMSIM